MKHIFYRCSHCGNIIAYVKNSHVSVSCCGEKMTEVVPNTVDASHEKHIPVYTVDGNTVHVKVATTEHPMLPEHYIEWIFIQTKQGKQLKKLYPKGVPEACFTLCKGDEVDSVYAYCNLHGLWKV